MNTLLQFLVILLLSLVVLADDAPPIVQTLNGRVQGNFQTSYGGRTFTAFEGVPYAKPPSRFEDPEPMEKWNDILIANKIYMCAQFIPFPVMHGFHGSEDCLYLYVYVPRKKITAEENLPVVVHIHGGAFMMGAPKLFALPDYLMDQDVILVTMNYRLGVLGFLSTGDDAASGNYGLKDQSMALKWIKDNIKFFGGNPDSITLTGESAGGASVEYHYLSPWSRGLFHRGIAQSGSTLAPWAIKYNPVKYAKKTALYVNCTIEDNQEMVDCLKMKDTKKITESFKASMVGAHLLPLCSFSPVIDNGKNPFLPEHPYKLLKEGKVYDVPFIHSNLMAEGLIFVGLLTLVGKISLIGKEWNKYSPYMFDYYETVSNDRKNEVSQKIREHYFKDEILKRENAEILAEIISERDFFRPAEHSIRLLVKANKSPIYYSLIDYVLQQPFIGPYKPRATHGDDIKLYLKTVWNPSKLKATDEQMVKLFTGFIYEYALNGVPKFGNVEWKPVKPEAPEIDYLLIASPTNVTMKSMKELAQNQFWDSLQIQENNHLFS